MFVVSVFGHSGDCSRFVVHGIEFMFLSEEEEVDELDEHDRGDEDIFEKAELIEVISVSGVN